MAPLPFNPYEPTKNAIPFSTRQRQTSASIRAPITIITKKANCSRWAAPRWRNRDLTFPVPILLSLPRPLPNGSCATMALWRCLCTYVFRVGVFFYIFCTAYTYTHTHTRRRCLGIPVAAELCATSGSMYVCVCMCQRWANMFGTLRDWNGTLKTGK